MIRCAKCKRFVRNAHIKLNQFTDTLHDARGDCARCGTNVELDWDAAEDWDLGEDG